MADLVGRRLYVGTQHIKMSAKISARFTMRRGAIKGLRRIRASGALACPIRLGLISGRGTYGGTYYAFPESSAVIKAAKR